MALVPACARGEPDPSTDTSPITPASDADSGAGAPACVGCPAGYVCSAGQCVGTNADNDHDGFLGKEDCDDHDVNVHPGAVEICNGKDDNCDGKIDEGFDIDGDGWASCAVGATAADCDDKDPTVNPGAQEACNGKDDNCDGKIDEAYDKDNDGFYSCPRNGLPADCDDADAKANPGASEVCNNKDDDCDGKIDELPANLSGSLVAPVNPHWSLAGSATLQSGWVALTPDVQTYKAGALWWNATYLFDSFDASATFWMQAKTDCADGITFAFVPGNLVNEVGGAGAGYGWQNLGGYAVAIDTFQNPGEPAVPFLALIDGTNNTTTVLLRQAIPEVRNALNHQLRVKLDGGKVSVWLDSVSYVFEYPLPGYVPFLGRWGFTAGTGSLTCAQYVRDATMSFPNGQGCVP